MLAPNSTTRRPRWVKLALLTVAIYLCVQTCLVIGHEYTHSTTAWLLGYTPTPRTVVWGDPITMTGWDEGVPYDQLFPSRGNPEEALIGGSPLLMHTLFVIAGLYLLLRPALTRYRLGFYAIYWFVVVNLAELVAYLLMRAFAGGGDTGRFNQGLNLSPWPLFLAGTAFLTVALGILLVKVTPRLDHVLGESRRAHMVLASLVAFVMFLSGSGLRILALYPDRQWKFGLIGPVPFVLWLLADHSLASSRST